MRQKLLAILVVLISATAFAAEQKDSAVSNRNSYVPKIGGVLRARWEMETSGGLNRFELRNARVNLSGRIGAPIDYYVQADLCDQGSFKFLDGWVRLRPFDGVFVQAGQFRMPFGVDPFRGPATYIFANRSFIGRYISNVRAVGFKAGWQLPRLPLTVEGGVFNPTTITDHTVWTHQKAYAVKAVLSVGKFSIAAGVQSLLPDSVRINLLDAAVTYRCGGWLAEAEYMYKHYTGNAHRPCHSVNAYVDYGRAVKAGIFNRWSAQARFDMQTDHSSGVRGDDGLLYTTQPARRRITVGSTLIYILPAVHCDLRVNYEKYFYNHDAVIPVGADDKIVAEIVLKF